MDVWLIAGFLAGWFIGNLWGRHRGYYRGRSDALRYAATTFAAVIRDTLPSHRDNTPPESH